MRTTLVQSVSLVWRVRSGNRATGVISRSFRQSPRTPYLDRDVHKSEMPTNRQVILLGLNGQTGNISELLQQSFATSPTPVCSERMMRNLPFWGRYGRS